MQIARKLQRQCFFSNIAPLQLIAAGLIFQLWTIKMLSLVIVACRACPTNAECPGGAVLTPVDSYWHSAYDSAAVQICPNTYACK